MPPPNTCKSCGDGTQPGHELYDGCEKQRERPRAAIPQDNWRASVRYGHKR